ncbi:TAXI family TRAP transporter solute-binding subunit [Marinobacterium rhizophilum]|uniref:TAXI family TRAP transporter solute-binding subunit n=1 Tax=Marinobacterium rhizophilum TaxID=420402 RepID=A0ABY5HJ65_9GAMM|nr:TAXI family TRAP transporter solute-binding subunit [Marinobacterium rhizophilum]UTW12418.1 TAXI family TRAP transporter solute-binding subunit [Marinobacterium rhizophilum]
MISASIKIIAKFSAGCLLSALASGPVMAAEKYFKMDTLAPGSSPYVFSVALVDLVQTQYPYEIQLSSGKAASRSTLDAAKGNVDFYLSAPAIDLSMEQGTDMFAKLADAPELYKKVRSVVSYPLGAYQFVVYEDSGIKSLADLKGKKVFIGPRGGQAFSSATSLLEAVTGYKPNEDYEVAFYDWSTAIQSFQDRQIDAYIGPNTVPYSQLSQIALSDRIRLLGIPQALLDKPDVKSLFSMPGKSLETIPPAVYGENQTNEADVYTLGAYVGLGTHVGVDEETVYNVTKTLFDNLPELHQTAPWMKAINRDNAFRQMVTPLHLGAYRFYKEGGFEIPEALVPPQAR